MNKEDSSAAQHAADEGQPGNVITGEAVELFDLDTDHDEATNLVDDAASSNELARLTAALGSTIGTS